MEMTADWISGIINETKNQVLPEDKLKRREAPKSFWSSIGRNAKISETEDRVTDLCKRFPLYPELR